MRSFLLMFTIDINSALPHLKLLAFALLLEIFRDFPLFTVGSSRKNCPSARCASAANTARKDVDIFKNNFVMLKHILKFYFL
jgi:hypothetical protein